MIEAAKITIAIPVYERYDFFEEAIGSVLSQTIPCTIIVVDNCSGHDRFKDYVAGLRNADVTYYRNNENLGMYGNINRCIELCKTEWLSILHDDDALHSGYAAHISELIGQYPETGTFLVRCEVGAEPLKIRNPVAGSYKARKIYEKEFLLGNVTPFPGVTFNILKHRGVFFDPAWYPVSDYEYWYRLAKQHPLVLSNRVLAFYRLSDNQASTTAYIKTIEKSYELRLQMNGFHNWFYRLFSLFSIYRLYRLYRRTYHDKSSVRFPYKELNTSLRIFGWPVIEWPMTALYGVVLKMKPLLFRKP